MNDLINLVARSLFFSEANIMFGWQGWAYRQATEWRRLHDTWDGMSIDEKNIWLEKATTFLANIEQENPDLYSHIINGYLNPEGFRWWST
jgi:hypothetical protein